MRMELIARGLVRNGNKPQFYATLKDARAGVRGLKQSPRAAAGDGELVGGKRVRPTKGRGEV